MNTPSDDIIRKILKNSRILAVIGCSEKPWRTSYHISELMKGKGFRIIPVNPNFTHILSEICYDDINDVPVNEKIDIAVIFRNRTFTEAAVESVIRRVERTGKPIVIWTQLGVSSPEARHLADEHGLTYIENSCIAVEWNRLIGI